MEQHWKVSTVSLQQRVTIRAAMEHKHRDVQFILEALVGSLVGLAAERDLLLEDDNFESLKKAKWTVVSLKDSLLGKTHQAKGYVFFDTCVWEEARCGELQIKFVVMWSEHRTEGVSNTSKFIHTLLVSLPQRCWRRYLVHFRPFGQACVHEMYLPSHHLLGDDEGELEVTDKPHKNDEHAQELCAHAARFWPGWIGKDLEIPTLRGRQSHGYWDRKVLRTESGRPVIPSTGIFEQGCRSLCIGRRLEGLSTTFQNKTAAARRRGLSLFLLCAVIFSSHRRSSAGDVPLSARSVACVSNPRKYQNKKGIPKGRNDTISTLICKLFDSANQLCIFAITEYLHGLLGKTLIEAKESSCTHKITTSRSSKLSSSNRLSSRRNRERKPSHSWKTVKLILKRFSRKSWL